MTASPRSTAHGPHARRATPPPAVVVDGLVCHLGGRKVLPGIDLRVAAGERVGLLGPNGSGKTTLLRCIAGLQKPSQGRVLVMGEDVRATRPSVLARRLALQAQDSNAALGFTVRDLVGMGRLAHRRGFARGESTRDEVVVSACLKAFALEPLANRLVESLSGGERQRAMIARALAQEPAVLLLDEPTNHLDVRHRFDVLDRVRTAGVTVLASLHDIELAARHCDRVVLLDGGTIVADAAPDEALTPENLERVYAVAALVDRSPTTGQIRIDFQPWRAEASP